MRNYRLALACGCGAMALALSACGSSEDMDGAEEQLGEVVEEGEASSDAVEAGGAVTPEAPAAEVASPPVDPIRGPGGLEEKCLAEVNEMVGGAVIGTNRIEEAESGVAIYVNVDGATAPWRCFGYRDGTIDGVMFTGDEGAL